MWQHEQREEYWQNRALPFWQHIWPKSRDLVTSNIAASLIRMSIAAGKQFPDVLNAIYDWLVPIEHMHYVIHMLHESGLCTVFPEAALRLLAAVVDEQGWPSSELRPCMEAIAEQQANLAQRPEYRSLMEYMRRRGQA